MKRTVVTLVALAVATAPAGAEAAVKKPKKHTRVVTIDYRTGPVLNGAGAFNGVVCNLNGVETATCTEVPLKSDEAFFKIVATDTTGQPVGIQWHEGSLPTPDSDNGYSSASITCGSAKGKLKKPKQIVVYAGPNIPACALATTGKLVVTISNYAV